MASYCSDLKKGANQVYEDLQFLFNRIQLLNNISGDNRSRIHPMMYQQICKQHIFLIFYGKMRL